MSVVRYPTGDKYWFDFQAGALATYMYAALLSSYSPDPTTEVFMSDVSASEPTDGSWTRLAITGRTVTTDLPTGYNLMDADDPDFGSPVGGETVGWVLVFADAGADSASPLMSAYTVSHTADGSPFAPAVHTLGLTRFRDP